MADNSHLLSQNNVNDNYLNTNCIKATTTPNRNIPNIDTMNNEDNGPLNQNTSKSADVVSSTIEQPDNGCETSTTKSLEYLCAPCNTLVPIIYKAEHDTSIRHLSRFKISGAPTNKVAKCKTSLDLMFDYKDTYYCNPCSNAVKLDYKQIHERSRRHKKSLSREKFLYSLLMICKDKDSLIASDPRNLTNNDSFKDGFENVDKDITKTIKSDSKPNNLANENVGNDGNNNELSVDKTEDDKSIVTCTKLVKTKDDKLVKRIVTTLEKYVMEIPLDNYNSLYTRDGTTVCRVCGMVVRQSTSYHILKKDHVQKVIIPFENMHCFRQISARFIHCALCNEMITQKIAHECSRSHVFNLIRAVRLPSSETPDHSRAALTNTLINLIQTHIIPIHHAPIYPNVYLMGPILPPPRRPRFQAISTEPRRHGEFSHLRPVKTPSMKYRAVEQLSSVEVEEMLDRFNNRERFQFLSVLKTSCETCKIGTHTREWPGHLWSEQHIDNANLMRNPEPGKAEAGS